MIPMVSVILNYYPSGLCLNRLKPLEKSDWHGNLS
ncbi:unnamed protein product [Brassica oleracea var. botrytis]|uniref:(rape) hypothetical protein n=1 Tax=Brassica napus TaxID=3708 RepID=A0A078GZB5_BRANA|nr:unnamed protein product [Brassica napus]CDY30851.1 BnaC04g27060D [Brassica napus]